MKTNLKELTKQYAKLVAKENAIKAEKSEMSLQIKEALKKAGSTTFGTEEGVFSLYKVATWVFSNKVQAKVEEVEALKEREKATGVAKATFNDTLRFNSRK